jgi:hypothetical protein
MTDRLVRLDEVAEVYGRRLEEIRAEFTGLDLSVYEDWAGRPALTEDDARALVSGNARSTQEHRKAWEAHQAACREWESDRAAAVKRGADEAEAKARRRVALGERIPGDFVPNELSPGAVDGIRYEAARHAGAQFERRHPRPEFKGSRNSVHLMYVPESEEGSLLAAAVGKVKGPAKPGALKEREVA